MPTPAGRSVYACCPFYRKDTRTAIYCEGLTDESTILQSYRDGRSCAVQFDTFCSRFYERCELYQAIVQAKYLPDVEEAEGR